jgi:glutathione S-transferase
MDIDGCVCICQMVLVKKGVFYVKENVNISSMPEWLREDHGAQLPCLRNQNTILTEPLQIAEHVERCYPHKSLAKMGTFSYQEVLDRTSTFFPTVRACVAAFEDQNIKTRDDISPHNKEILNVILQELEKVDALVRSTPGRYLGGVDMTLADLRMTPYLFRTVVAVEHFFKHPILHIKSASGPTLPALEDYMMHMFSKEIFKDSRVYCDVDKIVHGWKAVKASIQERSNALLPEQSKIVGASSENRVHEIAAGLRKE